jgi:hypothetical protein
MMKVRTLSKCFAHFGAVCGRQFSRSAISRDGRIVVVTMWDDEFGREGNRVTYETRYRPALKGKSRSIGSEWVANLSWARAHCDGLVRVVVLAPRMSTRIPERFCTAIPMTA